MSKTALITGITGQDGAYLAKFLLQKNYKVFGTFRRLSTPNFWRLHYLGIYDKVSFLPCDVTDSISISECVDKSDPDEIFHLAAQSFVAASFDQPVYTTEVTGLGTMKVLDVIKRSPKKIKFYQASSSEMYGDEPSKIKNEITPFQPSSPYAISKLYSHWTVNLYRKAYGIHATSGILFNHESSLRGLEFVTRKITNGVAKMSLGLSKNLKLGNISAKRDWGYAPEYVEGMWSMLQQKNPDDYVLATNETHTVKEFIDEACKIAGITSKKIQTSKENFRPFDVQYLRGNSKKANKDFGWKPKIKFKKLVKLMVEEDLSRWERWLKKEYFPWDALLSGEDSKIISKN